MKIIEAPCVECNINILYPIPGYPTIAECSKCGHPNDVPTELKTNKHMIKIEFEAATGADLRKEMLDLLGIGDFGTFSTTLKGEDLRIELDRKVEAIKETSEDLKEQSTAQETPKPEQPTRTRRSKAQIEAEAATLAANTGAEEPPASTENVESAAAEYYEPLTGSENDRTVVTAEDLTKKCVELGRDGKRDAVLAVFETQFGGATISKKDGKPQLTAEQYPAVMEALNAIA